MVSVKMIVGLVVILISIVIILAVSEVIIPEAQSAGDSLNETNQCARVGCLFNTSNNVCQVGVDDSSGCGVNTTVPLSGLFSGGGVVFVIIMASILLIILFIAFGPLRKGKE